MNPSTLLGMLLAAAIVVLGAVFSTRAPVDLLDLPSLVLVIGGTAAEAQIFRSMATYAPAFGMLGTLLGLINMLHGLQGDFQSIGANMALAMITTLYGILLSNLLFKPIAIKFERRTERRVMQMNMVLEGVALMAQRRSPSFIRLYLESLEAHHEDEIRQIDMKASKGTAGQAGR